MTGDTPSSTGRLFRSASHRRQALLAVGALVGGVLFLSVVLWRVSPFVFDPTWLRGQIRATGRIAPLVFVALQTVQVIFAPIPGQVLGTVGGYLFGSVAGTAYSMLGVTLGSSVVFLTGKRYGRPFVSRVVTDDALDRFDSFVDEYGTVGLFVVFLLPTFPDDAICLVAGLSEIRFRSFLALLVVGRTPAFFGTAFAGTALAEGRIVQFFLVVLGMAVVSALVYQFRTRLTRHLGTVTDRVGT